MRQGDLPFEAFERVIAIHPDLRHIELQGEGEPLMHPRFFDMVALCRQKNIEVSMITNGSYLTEANVAGILDGGIRSVSVSLESSDFGAFREIRGGKLEKVVRGLELLMAKRRERGAARPIVGFSVTVLRRTSDALPGIIALYRQLSLDGTIAIQMLQDRSPYVDCYDSAMKAQVLSPEETARYFKEARRNEEFLAVLRDGKSLGFYAELERDWDPREATCPWLESGGYVNIDGHVTGCCQIKSADQAFGNIHRDPVEKLDAARDSLRLLLKQGQIPEPCKGCPTAETAISRDRRQIAWARKRREASAGR
jgi:MoaA/NifB/PqqE/SkfB family radical SAM enzyme